MEISGEILKNFEKFIIGGGYYSQPKSKHFKILFISKIKYGKTLLLFVLVQKQTVTNGHIL